MNGTAVDVALLSCRSATAADKPWLWKLYCDLLKPAITVQWGWNEAFQREQFQSRLPIDLFTLVEKNTTAIAAYALRDNSDHLYLHMLLVTQTQQSRGVGSWILNRLKQRANQLNIPLELSTFPANAVDAYYTKNGFKLLEVTSDKHRYRWMPNRNPLSPVSLNS